MISLLPAVSLIGGVLIAVFSVQMAIGAQVPKLPRRLARLRFSTDQLQWTIKRVLPVLSRLERYIAPRWPALSAPPFLNMVGAFMAIVSLTFALPVPFTQLPPGLAILLIALGMLERDGRILATGLLVGSGSLVVGYFAIKGTGRAIGLW